MSLFLGREIVNGSPVKLPAKAFLRHLMVLGASGSGKTVLCKCVMEEAVRNNIPLIIVDPQGDIASLALKGNLEKIEDHGTPVAIQEEFFQKARIAIFTPASCNAIPISVNPLKFPSKDASREESILALDMTATSLASFLGYDLDSDAGKGAKAYLFTLLQHLWQEEKPIRDIDDMADIVLTPPAKIRGTIYDLVTKKEPQEIARKLRFLTVGTPSLMFQMGAQINIDMFMDRSDGKIPVNIIYMNTLNSSNDKQFFLSTLLRELYCWMLKNPSEEVQLLFYVDEIAPYIPPHPRNPPPKEAYSLLFKQARKYGIGLVAATQNVTDIDYKALAQVNTWCLGRLMTKQDITRVQKIIQSIDPVRADKVLQKLPSLRTGEFMMLSPDFYDDVVDFQVRWLVTDHQTLDEKDLPEILSGESRQFFEKYMMQKRERAVPSPSLTPLQTIDEQVQLFLDSARQAVPIDVIAQNLKLNTEDVEKALRKLVKTKVVKRGRVSGEREYVYWLSKFGFNPSKNIVGEVITIPARISQIEVTKRSKSLLEGGFWGKKEEIYDVEFSQIPIWRITATRKFRKLLFTKEKTGTYYLSAQTGALVSLGKKRIVFRKVVTKGEKLKGLHTDKDVAFMSKMPSEVENFPNIKMGTRRIYRKLMRTLGVEPVSAGMVLLPVWTLKVKHKKTLAKRKITFDAATGRILAGHF